jgi:hypothetical protein
MVKLVLGSVSIHSADPGYQYFLEKEDGTYKEIRFFEHGMEPPNIPFNELAWYYVYDEPEYYEAIYDEMGYPRFTRVT